MAEYLIPYNSKLNIEEKRKMFEIRNRMTKIPNNFGNKEEKCVCGQVENLPHIYLCESYNEKKVEISYKELYNGNLLNQIEIFRRVEKNLKKRTEIKSPCDLSDPLNCTQSRFG